MEAIYPYILVALLLAVLFELGQALYFMMVDKGRSSRTVWALTRRIALSVLLIATIGLGIWMGWVAPHGVGG